MNEFIHKISLTSTTPEKLIVGRTYLCGEVNLGGNQINWTTREFDGQTLRICGDGIMLGDGPVWGIDETYMNSPDGWTPSPYLIFELPQPPIPYEKARPDEG